MPRASHWLVGLALCAAAGAAAAQQVRFFEHDAFRGRSFTSNNPVRDFSRIGFNDRASSVVVRGGPWEVCSDARFGGRCVMLRPGRYGSLSAMGLNDRVSSARPARRDRDRDRDRDGDRDGDRRYRN
jgi:hypothetical protein